MPKINFDGGYFIDIEAFNDAVICGKLKQLPRCQDMLKHFPEIVAINPADYENRYFISHRWDADHNPDIRGWQFDALYDIASELIYKEKTPACFWYDYCSLPQAPRTTDEEILFKEGLQKINHLCRTCNNFPLISKTDDDGNASIKNMLKRGWILVELFISLHHGNINLAIFEGCTGSYITFSKMNRLNWDATLPDLMRKLPFYDPALIRKWFDVNGVVCTNGADLDFVAGLLYEHVYTYITANKQDETIHFEIDTPQILSNEKIGLYFINEHGYSAYFPGIFFECLYRAEKFQYQVIPRRIPTLPNIDEWVQLPASKFKSYQINLQTLKSPLYPGITFDYRHHDDIYHLKAMVERLEW